MNDIFIGKKNALNYTPAKVCAKSHPGDGEFFLVSSLLHLWPTFPCKPHTHTEHSTPFRWAKLHVFAFSVETCHTPNINHGLIWYLPVSLGHLNFAPNQNPHLYLNICGYIYKSAFSCWAVFQSLLMSYGDSALFLYCGHIISFSFLFYNGKLFVVFPPLQANFKVFAVIIFI